MAGITTYLSILTMSANSLTPTSNDIDWQVGLKRKK
jgi:hypothetical protein